MRSKVVDRSARLVAVETSHRQIFVTARKRERFTVPENPCEMSVSGAGSRITGFQGVV